MKIKLQDWARQNGISRATAYRLFVENKLPYPVERVGERIILLDVPDEPVKGRTVAYLRVSTRSQQEYLVNQKLRVLEWAVKNGVQVDDIVEEVGSGLNENRKGLTKLLADPNVRTIVVEYRDRLSRHGFKLLEASLKAQGREIIVVDDTELDDDIVRDITEYLTSISGRLYGKRGAKARAEKAARSLQVDEV